MIQENDEYLYTLDNDSIKAVSGLDLTDDECEEVAYEIEDMLDGIIRDVAQKVRGTSARSYKKESVDRARHLCEFIGFTTDHDVLMCPDGSLASRTFKFMDADGFASPFYVGGTTWKDVYMSLCAIEDAIAFTIEQARED